MRIVFSVRSQGMSELQSRKQRSPAPVRFQSIIFSVEIFRFYVDHVNVLRRLASDLDPSFCLAVMHCSVPFLCGTASNLLSHNGLLY